MQTENQQIEERITTTVPKEDIAQEKKDEHPEEGKSISADIQDLQSMAETALDQLQVSQRSNQFVQRNRLTSATDKLKNLGKSQDANINDPK